MECDEDTINDSFDEDDVPQIAQTQHNSNEFRILLATDIHLGYKENDSVRGQDTFNTFEEILKIGVSENVDFILLGGDLFHDTKPSTYCLNECTRLLRKYCLGENPIGIEILSDQRLNFNHTLSQQVNYEDPNINVGTPVFSIHGNHDDPTGKNHVSAMDLLASMGLVNYFGRWDNLTHVEINPILMRKGHTLLALYGLSHISDQRLGRLFLEKKVSITVPDNINNREVFNLLVIHQNRAPRGPKNFIPPDAIPKDIDLVMWGHEHDCRITPEHEANVIITQPGSSVATSLAAGEAITKKVGILTIHKKQFKIDEIELRTVRPFIFEDIMLDFPEVSMQHQLEKSKKVITMRVEEMIEKAGQLNRIPEGILPLIRLRAHYKHEDQIFNAIKFSQQFVGRVANPEDILKFYNISSKRQKTVFNKDLDEDVHFNPNIRRVEDIILKYVAKNQMKVLSAKGLTDGVMKYIDTDDIDAPVQIIDHQFQKTLNKMKELAPEDDEIESCIENLRQMREDQDDDDEEVNNILSRVGAVKNSPVDSDAERDSIVIDDDDEEDKPDVSAIIASIPRPTRGKGSRGGRGSRSRARGKIKA